jgi:hypothetical protein
MIDPTNDIVKQCPDCTDQLWLDEGIWVHWDTGKRQCEPVIIVEPEI